MEKLSIIKRKPETCKDFRERKKNIVSTNSPVLCFRDIG